MGSAMKTAAAQDRQSHSRCSVLGGVLVTAVLFGCENGPAPSPAIPTEREKQEAGTRAILREYGPPGQSDEKIKQGAKSVVDEWEKVSNKR